MDKEQLLLLLIGLLIWSLVGRLLPKALFYFKAWKTKIYVGLFFKSKNKKSVRGFGLVINGVPLLDGKNPKIFMTPTEAENYAINRNFYERNPLTKSKLKVKVIYQDWNLDNLTLTWNEVIYAANE